MCNPKGETPGDRERGKSQAKTPGQAMRERGDERNGVTWTAGRNLKSGQQKPRIEHGHKGSGAHGVLKKYAGAEAFEKMCHGAAR